MHRGRRKTFYRFRRTQLETLSQSPLRYLAGPTRLGNARRRDQRVADGENAESSEISYTSHMPPEALDKERKATAREISAGIVVFRRTPEGPRFLILYHGGEYWN